MKWTATCSIAIRISCYICCFLIYMIKYRATIVFEVWAVAAWIYAGCEFCSCGSVVAQSRKGSLLEIWHRPYSRGRNQNWLRWMSRLRSLWKRPQNQQPWSINTVIHRAQIPSGIQRDPNSYTQGPKKSTHTTVQSWICLTLKSIGKNQQRLSTSNTNNNKYTLGSLSVWQGSSAYWILMKTIDDQSCSTIEQD